MSINEGLFQLCAYTLTLHSATILALAVFVSWHAGYIPVEYRVIQLTIIGNKNNGDHVHIIL